MKKIEVQSKELTEEQRELMKEIQSNNLYTLSDVIQYVLKLEKRIKELEGGK